MTVTIKGGIKFEAGKPMPAKFKKFVDAYGIKTPFDPDTTTFSGRNIPKIRKKSIDEIAVGKDIEVDKDAVITEVLKSK